MTDEPTRRSAATTEIAEAGKTVEAASLLQRLLGVTKLGPEQTQQREAAPPSSRLRRFFSRAKQPATLTTSVAASGIPDSQKFKPAVIETKAKARTESAPTGGRFIERSFTNEAGTRNYKLFIPGGGNGAKRPLIMMLHGCGQSPADFAAGTRMNVCAQEHGCFVVYPEQPKSANPSKCWNWFNTADQMRGAGEPSLLAGIAQAIAAEHNIDTRRIYAAGLSAGGAAAAVLAETYPDVFAAIGVHSGLACGSARDIASAFMAMSGKPQTTLEKPTAFVPTIVFHGDRDTTVHPRNAAGVVARARMNVNVQTLIETSNAAGRSYTRSVYRSKKGVPLIEDWQIHGAGHAWSGGCTKGSFVDPKGPDASREMLRFFLQHSLAR